MKRIAICFALWLTVAVSAAPAQDTQPTRDRPDSQFQAHEKHAEKASPVEKTVKKPAMASETAEEKDPTGVKTMTLGTVPRVDMKTAKPTANPLAESITAIAPPRMKFDLPMISYDDKLLLLREATGNPALKYSDVSAPIVFNRDRMGHIMAGELWFHEPMLVTASDDYSAVFDGKGYAVLDLRNMPPGTPVIVTSSLTALEDGTAVLHLMKNGEVVKTTSAPLEADQGRSLAIVFTPTAMDTELRLCTVFYEDVESEKIGHSLFHQYQAISVK